MTQHEKDDSLCLQTQRQLPHGKRKLPQPLQVNSVAISGDGQTCIYGSSSEFGQGQFDVFCYTGAGEQVWKWLFSQPDATQGVFWVAVSSDGKFAAAGGEVEKHDNGLLTAYSVSTGAQLLNVSLSSRVNQVSLSADGQYLLAVFGGTVQLYALSSDQSSYSLSSEISLSPYYLNSAETGRRWAISRCIGHDVF